MKDLLTKLLSNPPHDSPLEPVKHSVSVHSYPALSTPDNANTNQLDSASSGACKSTLPRSPSFSTYELAFSPTSYSPGEAIALRDFYRRKNILQPTCSGFRLIPI